MKRLAKAAAIALALAIVASAAPAEAKTQLKLGTLAPPRSPWGKVFKTWAKAVEQKTNGEVEVIWLWNGTAGPETAMVGKIRSGQLSGAAITAVGLSDIHKPIVALQMPGVFSNWTELDKARNQLIPEFEAAMKQAGFHLAGFGDVGMSRIMSKGYAVRVPGDLKGRHPSVITEDAIYPKVFEVIGGVSPVPGSVTAFLPKLNSGAIDTMITPALAAEQLQWAPRLDHINTVTTGFNIGAVVLSQKQLEQLSADQREIVTSTGKQAAAALTQRIRQADDEAYGRMKKKMKTHTPTGAEEAEWKKVFKAACQRLKGALPGDVLTKIGAC
jgi:TRAP-type C4-dicarboxylate transport system substrate-binding protein